jgi:antitoxin component of MazEF toxin-antitoxin module
MYYVLYYIISMPKLVVRRTGNSLGLPIPREIVRDLSLSAGDELLVQLERVPGVLSLAGRLKGRLTAREFTRLSNEGEEVD